MEGRKERMNLRKYIIGRNEGRKERTNEQRKDRNERKESIGEKLTNQNGVLNSAVMSLAIKV